MLKISKNIILLKEQLILLIEKMFQATIHSFRNVIWLNVIFKWWIIIRQKLLWKLLLKVEQIQVKDNSIMNSMRFSLVWKDKKLYWQKVVLT